MDSSPLVSTLRAALQAEQNVRFALLFGSAATGASGLRSDVDVLVDLGDPSFDRLIDLTAELTAVTGRRVDLVRLQDAEGDALFLADLLAEGRVLVDTGALWPRLRRREPVLRRLGRQQQAERKDAALAGIDRFLAATRVR